ncbi:MAG: protein TonB [Methylophilaceae bacterium]
MLLLNGPKSQLPLAMVKSQNRYGGLTLQLQKTTNVIGAQLFNLAIKSNNNGIKQTRPAWSKLFFLLLVMLVHTAVFSMLVNGQPPPVNMEKSAAPILVSILAPLMPEPEMVRTVVPVKITKKTKTKPKVKPKKIIKKVVPVVEATQPIVEAFIEPGVENVVLEDNMEVAASVLAAANKVAEVVQLEEKIKPPKFGVSYLNNPVPSYPRFSRRKGEEGRVLLKVLVTAKGGPGQVEVENSSGYKRLDEAAINAVQNWRFIPARKGAEALSAYVLVPVKFSLDN